MKSGLMLFVLIFSFSVHAEPTPSSVLDNQQGISQLKENNPSAAQQKFLSGLSSNPLEPKLHYNLGLSYDALGQPEKAQSAYQSALELAQDDVTRFAAHFNLGVLAQKAKKKEEALKHYQAALRLNPQSIETKSNIELLTQDQQGQGEGKSDEPQDSNEKKDQEQKGSQGDSKNEDQKNQDQKDQEQKDQEQKDKEQKEKEEPKQYAKPKPQPQKFKSGELTQGDVNKILGEIKQQEQKIRAEFNKKDVKEDPREKDW